MFEGKEYNTYSAMVDAKREHNKIWLEECGLLETAQHIKEATERQQTTTLRKQQGNYSGNETDTMTSTAKKLSATLWPHLPSKFGQEGFVLEWMTKESYTEMQLKVDDGSSHAETEGEDE